MLLDYLRNRIPTNDVNLVIESILKMDKKFFLYTDSGFSGYIGTFSFVGIRVLVFPTSDSKGTLIKLAGKGCRNLEAMLIAQNRSWYDFLRTTRKYNGNVTRIDLAINDKLELLPLTKLQERTNNGECVSKFWSIHSAQ